MSADDLAPVGEGRPRRPRVGFLGVGWIGRHRMQAMVDTGEIEAVGLADPSGQAVAEARRIAPAAEVCAGLDDLLRQDLDGVVIATPSALHARQTIRALEAGVAVFCQKPLGRDAGEARRAVDAARQADRLLAVDLSYRFTEAAQALRTLIRSGDLGRVFAADLTFHNAYGPDKGWFYDPALSGGGCLMDLGVHLVDLALWLLDETGATILSSTLLAQGRRCAIPARPKTMRWRPSCWPGERWSGSPVPGSSPRVRTPLYPRAFMGTRAARNCAIWADPSTTSVRSGSAEPPGRCWLVLLTTGVGERPAPGPRLWRWAGVSIRKSPRWF
jgi:hypothetical protein